MTLTQLDIKEIEKIIDERVKNLPTKEEFFSWMDKLMKELKDMREEHIILSGQVARHTEEIEKLQKIHPNNKHLSI